MESKKMKNKKNNQTIKIDYSPEVVSAIKAEANYRKISFNKVVEEMAKKFVERCGTPQIKNSNHILEESKNKTNFFASIGAVHLPRVRKIRIIEVEVG